MQELFRELQLLPSGFSGKDIIIYTIKITSDYYLAFCGAMPNGKSPYIF